jgi:8-oxo-dGTP pyrophosphatase MutT (NUDIX family)
MLPTHFLTDSHPLRADDAVAAIIMVEDGRYLMQLRDDIPRIFYPGHWGCFGGAVEPNETPMQALERELHEELGLQLTICQKFISLDFDLTKVGQRRYYRAYYAIIVAEKDISSFVLHEGAEMRLFQPNELFDRSNIVPYDSFAIWLHVARYRFATAGRVGL